MSKHRFDAGNYVQKPVMAGQFVGTKIYGVHVLASSNDRKSGGINTDDRVIVAIQFYLFANKFPHRSKRECQSSLLRMTTCFGRRLFVFRDEPATQDRCYGPGW